MSATGWVLVGLIGGLAAGARYLLDSELSHRFDTPFPIGILGVNLLGAFLIGLAAGSGLDGQAMVIVAGGAIGSFTTFSTWLLDTQRLAAAKLARLAWLNITLSTAAGFAAVALGHAITG